MMRYISIRSVGSMHEQLFVKVFVFKVVAKWFIGYMDA